MKNMDFLKFSFFVLCFVLCGIGDAAAEGDVLETVRARAVDLMINLKPVIFILAGFGLVGFAWMAIFNQISWKWFSNIAIGLFLVANMGLFVDTFTNLGKGTESKLKAEYGEQSLINYTDTLGNQGGYKATEGSTETPSAQTPQNNEGTGGNSSSDELPNYSGEEGTEGNNSGGGQGPLLPQDNPDEAKINDCAAKGMIWSAEKKTCISLLEDATGGIKLPTTGGDPVKECEEKGGQWIYPANKCSI